MWWTEMNEMELVLLGYIQSCKCIKKCKVKNKDYLFIGKTYFAVSNDLKLFFEL